MLANFSRKLKQYLRSFSVETVGGVEKAFISSNIFILAKRRPSVIGNDFFMLIERDAIWLK